VILAVGPLILGAARLWIELPLLGGVALLLLVQGIRLIRTAVPNPARRLDAIDLSVALFVLYASVRCLISSEPFARIEALDVMACAGIFLTCRYGMANRKYCMALLFLLVILGVGETAFGYYLSYHPAWLPFGPAESSQLQYAPRWLGTYDSPNHYACLLVMAIGAALALGSFSKLSWPLRIVLFYLALMMMVGVMFSGSRGSWIALVASIVALLVFGVRHGTVRWWIPVSCAVVLGAVVVSLFSLVPTVRDRFAETENLVLAGQAGGYLRAQLAQDVRSARNHPFFGTGPEAFVFVPSPGPGAASAPPEVLSHDDYLRCLDDYGLVGFGLVMFFIVAVTLKFFQPLWVDHRWQDRALAATGFAAWAALLVHSWIDFNLHIPANAFVFFALTGLAVGRFKVEKESVGPGIPPAPARLGHWLGWGVTFLGLLYGLEVARIAQGA
jgi:O-antigen ligase